jgi:DNA-binding transcriptional MerR regulator
VKPNGIPVTIAQAAEKTGRTERTIQRWIKLRLLSSWRMPDGRRVVMLAELMRVERDQRLRTLAAKRGAVMLAKRRSVS